MTTCIGFGAHEAHDNISSMLGLRVGTGYSPTAWGGRRSAGTKRYPSAMLDGYRKLNPSHGGASGNFPAIHRQRQPTGRRFLHSGRRLRFG